MSQQTNELISCGPAWKAGPAATDRVPSTQGKEKDPFLSISHWEDSRKKVTEEEAELGFLLMGAVFQISLFSKPTATLGSSCCWSLGGKMLGSFRNASGLARKYIT